MDKLKVEICLLESLVPVKYQHRSGRLVDHGTSVKDLAPQETNQGNWSAIVNGKTFLPNEWDTTLLGNRSQVIYAPIPAAWVQAVWAFFGDIFALAVIGPMLASYALQLGISYLVGTPEVESFDGPGERVYSFNNFRQTASTGMPINIVYGTHPVAGNLIELDIRGYNPTEAESIYTSSLDMTIALCEGEIDEITAVSINGNDIASYGTVASYTSNVGTNAQSALGSAGTATTYTVGVTLVQGALISTEVYRLFNVLDNSDAWSSGGFGGGVVSDNPSSSNYLPSYINLGEGLDAGANSAVVNGSEGVTGTARLYAWSNSGSNFVARWVKVYSVSSGSNMDEVLDLTPDGELSFTTAGSGVAVGYEGTFFVEEATGVPETFDLIPAGGGYGEQTSYTTTSAVDSLRLNFTFPEGLYTQTASGIDPRTMTIVFQYRNKSEEPDGEFGALIERTLTNEQIGNFTWTIDIDFSDTENFPVPGEGADPSDPTTPPQSYEIKVQTVGVPDGEGAHAITLDSVVEIVDQVYAYPNTATIRAIINADESLNGTSVPNLVATVRGRKIQKWNEVSIDNPVFENDSPDYNNPAWIVWDLLTSTRYGLGNWISQDNLDLQSFQDWADWCNELVSDGAGGTEKRAIWNGVIDKTSSSWDACLRVCASARATLYTVGELVRVKFERDRSVTQLFSMANIIEGSFSQSYVSRLDRTTRIDVRYLRADSNYQVDTVGVDDPDAIAAGLPQRITTVELAGITRESQAMREARFRLNLEKLSTVVGWQAQIDSVACEPGDIVNLSHDVPNWGTSGRVFSATSSSVTLDADVSFGDMSAGNTYQIIVRHNSDDSRETRDIHTTHENSVVEAGDPITIQSAWTETPASLDIYTIGHAMNFTRKVVISSIRTTGELTRSIEGVLYDPAIHEDDIAVKALTAPFLPDAGQPPGVVTDLVALEVPGGDTSSTNSTIAVAWQYPTGVPLGGAKIYKRRVTRSGDYTLFDTVSWPRTQTTMVLGLAGLGSYQHTTEIAVVAVSTTGAHLPPTSGTSITFTPTGVTTISRAVSGVSLSPDEEELRIAWNPVNETSVSQYEVRRGLEWVGSVLLGITTDTELRTTNWTPTLSSGITENYMVRAVGPTRTYGNLGVATDTNTLPAWTGGSARTNDFRDSGAWTDCSLSGVTINSDNNLESSTPGGIGKVETDTYAVSASTTYRVGVIAHARIEGHSWDDASGYAWKSREGAARTWGGYVDRSNLSSVFEFEYRTRASSVATWSDWKPVATKTAKTAFKEIQLRVIITPNNEEDVGIIEQLFVRLES